MFLNQSRLSRMVRGTQAGTACPLDTLRAALAKSLCSAGHTVPTCAPLALIITLSIWDLMHFLLWSISAIDFKSRSAFSFGSPIWPVAPPTSKYGS